jgi:hypothetical protein
VPTHPDFVRVHDFEARRAQPGLVDELALAEALPAAPDPGPAAEVPAQLREMLVWAVHQLAEAQTPPALPSPDPVAGWEAFVASRLEFDPQAAVDVDALYLTYARWCAGRAEVPLEEDKALVWLTQHGASLRRGALSQTTMVVGVRVVA